MIKKILKDVLGENFTENNEKYAKINFIIVILMFLVSAIMLFFLPEKINILHNGDTYYPIPSILGIWLVPVISLVLNFTFIKQKKYYHGITSHWKYHILYYFDIVKDKTNEKNT